MKLVNEAKAGSQGWLESQTTMFNRGKNCVVLHEQSVKLWKHLTHLFTYTHTLKTSAIKKINWQISIYLKNCTWTSFTFSKIRKKIETASWSSFCTFSFCVQIFWVLFFQHPGNVLKRLDFMPLSSGPHWEAFIRGGHTYSPPGPTLKM